MVNEVCTWDMCAISINSFPLSLIVELLDALSGGYITHVEFDALALCIKNVQETWNKRGPDGLLQKENTHVFTVLCLNPHCLFDPISYPSHPT